MATPTTLQTYARPGEPIALKVYKPDILKEANERQRIRREYEIGASDPHPRLARAVGYSIDADPPYLVLEYIDGTSLDQWIKMFHPIPSDLRLHMARQLAEAVAHLHGL